LHPPPPISTPFPYTTLFRSDLGEHGDALAVGDDLPREIGAHLVQGSGKPGVVARRARGAVREQDHAVVRGRLAVDRDRVEAPLQDRKSTCLNSSHVAISYAV